MHKLKNIGLGILKYIGKVIILSIIAIVIGLGYFYLQTYIFGKGNYLLFISNNYSIPVFMLLILYIYFVATIVNKLDSKNELRGEEVFINELLNKYLNLLEFYVVRFIKICYIPVLLIAIYVGMTSYTILYSGSIKLGSPLHPSGVTYDYNDIKSIKVGLSEEDNSYYPYYEIMLNDGTSIDFFSGNMAESNQSFEDVLIDFDRKLRSQGIAKSVNKDNFEKYAEGLDKEFTSRVEKFFIK